MIKYIIYIIIALFFSGCISKPPYKTYKPKVRYKPSLKALDKLNKRALGKRYIWGEERAYRGFDCSGLTYYNFGTMGIEIPRIADEQYKSGTPVAFKNLQKGDLLFFATNSRTPWRATHVGIYLGDGKFEHASSSKKRVIVSSIYDSYYKRHFIGARRYYNFNNYQQCLPSIKRVEYTSNDNNIKNYKINNANTTSNNIFIQAQNNLNTQSGASKYYIILSSTNEDKNALLTKLELSGLRANINNNAIVVGPFNTQSDAIETKGRNLELLANSIIKAN